MNYHISIISAPGLVREKNEDNFIFELRTLENINKRIELESSGALNKPLLIGVFDGMGGISAGERASALAANTAKEAMLAYLNSDVEELLKSICLNANSSICDEFTSGCGKRMGTTASMLCFNNNRFWLCDIGDSPIFIMRNKKLIRISKEHSERCNFESINGYEAQRGKKFKLTQHLGILPSEMIIEPYIIPGEIKSGDAFLICSDGLTDMVDFSFIQEVLCKKPNDCILNAKVLMKKALQCGGKDNITIICGYMDD